MPEIQGTATPRNPVYFLATATNFQFQRVSDQEPSYCKLVEVHGEQKLLRACKYDRLGPLVDVQVETGPINRSACRFMPLVHGVAAASRFYWLSQPPHQSSRHLAPPRTQLLSGRALTSLSFSSSTLDTTGTREIALRCPARRLITRDPIDLLHECPSFFRRANSRHRTLDRQETTEEMEAVGQPGRR